MGGVNRERKDRGWSDVGAIKKTQQIFLRTGAGPNVRGIGRWGTRNGALVIIRSSGARFERVERVESWQRNIGGKGEN
jgi:hypothetical protein